VDRQRYDWSEQSMNRDVVLSNLREAAESLTNLIAEMTADFDYAQDQLWVDISHVYHHVNTAWNARDASVSRVEACSAEDFKAWRQFPADIDMTLGVE
jgi:hypothetical protein